MGKQAKLVAHFCFLRGDVLLLIFAYIVQVFICYLLCKLAELVVY